MKYPAVIEKTPPGYSSYLPDLLGCVVAADTLRETEARVQEAAAYHLEMLRENGDPIPQPQTAAPLWRRKLAGLHRVTPIV